MDGREQKSDDRLGSAGLGKLMFSMGMPALIAQLINLLYNIVDRIYIGHMPEVGSTALTGVGLVLPVIVIISSFSSFVGGGGAPLAAMALGRADRERASKIIGNGTTMLLVFSVVLPIIFFIVKEPFLFLIGASEATFPYADSYLSVYLAGTLFVQITVGLNTFITAQGRSGVAMLSVLIGAVINIVLDPVFIYLFDMGVRGAALATVLSQFFSALWIIVFLCSKKASLRIIPRYMKPEPGIVLSILSLGVAPFVMSITESLISIVMNSGLKRYGGDTYVGALTIMQSAMQIISVPVSGFTQGITPIISYNFGAGLRDRVVKTIKIMAVILFSYTTLLAAAMMVFPRTFASMFTDEGPLLELSTKALPIFVSGMLVFGIQRACQTAFLALGQSATSLFIAMLRKVILLVPLAMILPHFFGAMGIYYAEPIADATAATVCGIIFALRIRKILSSCK